MIHAFIAYYTHRLFLCLGEEEVFRVWLGEWKNGRLQYAYHLRDMYHVNSAHDDAGGGFCSEQIISRRERVIQRSVLQSTYMLCRILSFVPPMISLHNDIAVLLFSSRHKIESSQAHTLFRSKIATLYCFSTVVLCFVKTH